MECIEFMPTFTSFRPSLPVPPVVSRECRLRLRDVGRDGSLLNLLLRPIERHRWGLVRTGKDHRRNHMRAVRAADVARMGEMGQDTGREST